MKYLTIHEKHENDSIIPRCPTKHRCQNMETFHYAGPIAHCGNPHKGEFKKKLAAQQQTLGFYVENLPHYGTVEQRMGNIY